MQKLNTLSETGVCLVVIGCFAYAGSIQCTVRKRNFLTQYNVSTKITENRHFPSILPSCHNNLWIFSVLLFLQNTFFLNV